MYVNIRHSSMLDQLHIAVQASSQCESDQTVQHNAKLYFPPVLKFYYKLTVVIVLKSLS